MAGPPAAQEFHDPLKEHHCTLLCLLSLVMVWGWVAWKTWCGRDAMAPGAPGYCHRCDGGGKPRQE